MADRLDVAKEALAQIGTRSTLTSLSDGSPEATYINLLYDPIRDFLLTEGDYDFSLLSILPTPVAGGTLPWAYVYEYPVGSLRIRQLVPTSYSALDPRPIEWNVDGRFVYTTSAVKVILYTGPAGEDIWNAIFRQSFVRMLASALAFALENRIEASKVKLDEALGFAGVGKLRDM